MEEQKAPAIRITWKFYVVALVVFLLWMVFFDRNNWIEVYQMNSDYRSLEEDRNYYRNETEIVRTQYNELFGNPDSLEKFAREKYFMKKDNEDIFLIEEEK